MMRWLEGSISEGSHFDLWQGLGLVAFAIGSAIHLWIKPAGIRDIT